MNRDILVTIYLCTYNQEKYIEQALKGIINQKISFSFEVLAHDDASSDLTPQIIKEYAEKYDYIKPILQEENQYQRGVNILKEFLIPLTQGKYIAFCEGDDYWTDPFKLQHQIDYMEKHSDCTMTCHAYKDVSANDGKLISVVHTCPCDGFVTPEKAIIYDNPTQLATNVYRSEIVIHMPLLFQNRGVGDYPLLLYAISQGNVYYFDIDMANHRIGSDGSWSKRIYWDSIKRCEHNNEMISLLQSFDDYTNSKYADAIQKKINKYMLDNNITTYNYKEQKRNPEFLNLPIYRRVLTNIGAILPKFSALIEKMIRTKSSK